MADILVVLLAVGLFLASAAYVAGCERLLTPEKPDEQERP